MNENPNRPDYQLLRIGWRQSKDPGSSSGEAGLEKIVSNELGVWVVERNFRTFGGSLVKEQTHLAGRVKRVSVGEDNFGLGDVLTEGTHDDLGKDRCGVQAGEPYHKPIGLRQ